MTANPTTIAQELNDKTLVDGSEHPIHLIQVRYGLIVDADASNDYRIVLADYPDEPITWDATDGKWTAS